ncbi:MAG: deaminase, partial [Candidatus Aenigmarchaeota archaeon]|nr:deaminase [Candidatus Aenigmarchaeota archaeon]
MNEKINTKDAPGVIGFPLSQAIKAGKMLFTSGQIHLTPEGKLLDGTIEEKTHQVMKNLKSVLKEAGFSFK